MENKDTKILQQKLVDELLEKKFIKTKQVEDAFLSVPRHLFLPGIELKKIYSNNAIVTKWDNNIPLSSSSEPAVYAIMLEQMELREGLKILEIGAGTGFNAALMANITGNQGEVITIDIDDDTAASARSNLDSAGFNNVKVICKDGTSGYEEKAPYDRIIVTAGVWNISGKWFEQLKPGGILVVPMVINIRDQMTFAFRRVEEHLESSSISGCKFMELRGYYTRPVNQIEIGRAHLMILCSKFISKLNKSNNNINTKYPWKDFPTNVKATAGEIHLSFLPWLEIVEEKFCFLVSSVPAAEKILNMAVPHDTKGRTLSMLFGLADIDSVCFINLAEEPHNEKTDNAGSKSFMFYVRNFSNDQRLAEKLVERVIQWDKTGRPGIQKADVKVYFGNTNIKHSENEYIVSKDGIKLLFSWK